MPVRSVRFACLILPLALVACGDDPPVYPPIVIVQVVGNQGGSSVGAGATGNAPGQGGSSSSTGGTSVTGGGGSAGSGVDPGNPLFAHCSPFAAAPPPRAQTACDMDALTDGGELKGDITSDRTLESGKFYTMKGVVRVMQGKKLTIEPCVKVVGEDSNAVLVVVSSAIGNPDRGCAYSGGTVSPGGQLIAVGEPMAPIVFTSARPVGQRAPGDWGGVLILGNAHNNLATQQNQVPIEGLERAECHGYYNSDYDTESSGKLKYVRIEYASRQVSIDLETNGLTLGSVGSGTELDHVMVSNSADDCFEWFGGSVNGSHLIALNCDDDMFDSDTGFSGKLQFLFGRQGPRTKEKDSRGFEISKGSTVPTAIETSVKTSNFTICGAGPNGDQTATDRTGMFFQQVTSTVAMQNGIVTGFTKGGYKVDTASPSVTYTSIVETTPPVVDTAPFFGLPGNSTETLDRFCDCWANPPAPIAATPREGAGTDAYSDTSAKYVGAFADSSPESNWMNGAWVSWADK